MTPDTPTDQAVGDQALIVEPNTTAAAAFAGYSVANEGSVGTYLGMSVTRLNQPVTNQPSDGCSGDLSGSAVFQPVWYTLPLPGTYFEMGMGHQCNDTNRYYYHVVYKNNVLTNLGSSFGVANGSQHTLQIKKVNSPFNGWQVQFMLDGNMKWGPYLTNGILANVIGIGLESHCATCHVNTFYNHNLQYQTSDGLWHNWSGYDGTNLDPGMCGWWNTPAGWYSGQDATC